MVQLWRGVGASVTGSSHIAGGQGCQDAHAYQTLDNGYLVAVVADGAGSAARAADGANLAVQTAISAIAELLAKGRSGEWREVLITVLGRVRAALEKLAQHQETPLPTFATTLLIAVITPGEIAALQLGDGAIVTNAREGLENLTRPDHSEYLNETSFVTSPDYLQRVQVITRATHDLTGVALLSDGLQLLALNMADNTPFAPFFEPLFRFAGNPVAQASTLNSRLAAFLNSERVADASDDDKTLVLAVRL